MKNVFIVNTSKNGTKVVSQGVFEKDVKKRLESYQNVKIKSKDITAYATELMAEMNGKAIAEAEYVALVEQGADALAVVATTSIYALYKMIINKGN